MSTSERGIVFLGVAAIMAGIVVIGGAGFLAGWSASTALEQPAETAPTPTPDVCDPYAVAVVAHSPVMGPGEPPDSVDQVLGAEDGGSADFDNDGPIAGFVTIRFSAPAQDGAGDDIWFHHEDFTTVSAGGTPENEPFTLYGSADGQTFVALGSRQPTGPAVGQSSVFGFDIAGRLPSVRYVKVQNDTVVQDHPFEGPEIDAFEAAHLENCPAPTPPPNVISIPPGGGPSPGVSPIPTITPLTQCSDRLDNDGDNRIDAADPPCHTDFNANNPASYDPTRNNEAETFDPGGVREID